MLRASSNVGKEGKNVWWAAAMDFLFPSQPHIQLNNPSKQLFYEFKLDQNAISHLW